MAKHTQTIRRQQPTNCLNVFNHFIGLVLKGLKQNIDEASSHRQAPYSDTVSRIKLSLTREVPKC